MIVGMHLFVQIHPHPGCTLPQSFETLAELLIPLPGMVFEMDGSFVWVDHTPSKAFQPELRNQMDGMVYDREGKIQYIEVKGNCSRAQWFTLCEAVCNLADTRRSEVTTPDFDRFHSTIRIHRVDQGDWTIATAIAAALQ